jgi:hypothetical protein
MERGLVEDGVRELGREAFNQVQPGANLRVKINSKWPAACLASYAFVSLEVYPE